MTKSIHDCRVVMSVELVSSRQCPDAPRNPRRRWLLLMRSADCIVPRQNASVIEKCSNKSHIRAARTR
jgi:hypothetical protein